MYSRFQQIIDRDLRKLYGSVGDVETREDLLGENRITQMRGGGER